MTNPELLKRKFPVGTRVKLIEGRNLPAYSGLHPGSLGTVLGINQYGGIDVKWDECDYNYDLFFGYDRFSTIYGKNAGGEKA